MKYLLTSMALGLAVCSASASQIKSYEARVDAAAEGASRAQVNLQLEDVAAGTLLVPLAPALKPAGELRIDSAPRGSTVKIVTVGERPHLELVFPEGVEKEVPVQLNFAVKSTITEPKPSASGKKTLPDGSLLFNHSFVNTQPYAINGYRVEVVLPEGVRVHTVREATPKPKRSEIEPRVALDGKEDGRQTALLQMPVLKQGDRTSMSLEVVRDQRSWTWLIVGLVLSAAYLFGFRHLVAKPKS